MDITNYLTKKKELVDKALKRYIPSRNTYPAKIHNAIHYSIFNGGKRLRPALAIATCQTLGGSSQIVLPGACAVELVHCSSLILDDLPCMDNDDYRRGKPTCHRVFGEDTTILTGYAMILLAFEILSTHLKAPPEKTIKIISHLAHAAGSKGLIGGQVVDLASEGKKINKKTLEYIHLHKTAMLIEASVYIGAIIGNAAKRQLESLTNYGRKIGLAFQIADDLLDINGDKKKATYPGIYGVSKSMEILQKLKKEAISNLSTFGKRADILRGIADYIWGQVSKITLEGDPQV